MLWEFVDMSMCVCGWWDCLWGCHVSGKPAYLECGHMTSRNSREFEVSVVHIRSSRTTRDQLFKEELIVQMSFRWGT